ncbi:MAG TPA: PKD domain-containing protein [Thermoanaerobaculia bacterium]|nr:PKD domain-containing protein [Thermoanaerobaculia bacterium]
MRIWAAAAVLWVAAGSASAQCVSEVRELNPHTFNHLTAGPMAFNGSLIALASVEERTNAIWVSIYNIAGDLLYESVKLPSTEGAKIVDIVWNEDHFGLFLRTPDENKLQLRRINTTGQFFGSPINLLPTVTFTDTNEIDIIWSSQLQRYLIARTAVEPRRVWLTQIARDGVMTRNEDLAGTVEGSFVKIAMTPAGVLGVFFKAAPTGVLTYLRIVEGERNFSRELGTAGEDLLVATQGETFVLAQTILDLDDDRRAVEWRIIDTDGFETRKNARLLVGTGEDVDALDLVVLDDEYAISYLDARDGFDREEGSLRLRRFNEEGEPISDTLFAAGDRTRHRAASEHLIWTGNSFVTIAVRTFEDDEDESFLIRFCPLNAVIFGPRSARRNTPVTFTVEAGGGEPGYQYRWDLPTGTVDERTVQVMFATAGDYDVTVRVRDLSGAEVTERFTITITEDPAPPKPPKQRSVRK